MDAKQYHYRLYTTIYIKDIYALLFLNGELIAVHDEKQDFSECINIDAHSTWEQCLSDTLSEMSFHEISLGRHDFSRGIQAEQEEQAERDRIRVGTAAIAVPLTVALPGIIPVLCIFTCGAGCEDPGAKPGDYQDPCIGKLQSSLNAAASVVDANMSRIEIIKSLVQTSHDKKVLFEGKLEQYRNNSSILNFSWGCSYLSNGSWLNISTGFRDEKLRWAWFRYEKISAYNQEVFQGCKGTWEEVRKCAEEKEKRTLGRKNYKVLLEGGLRDEPDDEWELYNFKKYHGEYDFKWLCMAAKQGDYRARWELGYLHHYGLYGVRKDLVLSVMWYSLVEADGHNPKGVDNIREQLTPEQLSEADHLYENWKPGRCEREIMGTEPINTQ